jgi:hypothetical protein
MLMNSRFPVSLPVEPSLHDEECQQDRPYAKVTERHGQRCALALENLEMSQTN